MSNIYEALRRSEAKQKADQAGTPQSAEGAVQFQAESPSSSPPSPPDPDSSSVGGATASGDNTAQPQALGGQTLAPPSPPGALLRVPVAPIEYPHPQARFREAEPEAAEIPIEIRRLVWVLFRRRWEVAFVACLVVIPVAIATYFAPRLYRSIAQVQIEPEPLQVLPYRDIDLPRFTPPYEFFMKTQEQVLRGSALLSRLQQRVRKEPALHAEIDRLSGGLAIQRLEGTQIFLLGYVGPDPVAAAQVANLYAEEYIRLQFESRQEVREKARQLLERELEGLEQRVQQSEKQLVTYAQGHSIPVGASTVSLVQQKLASLGALVAEAESEVFVARTRLDTLQKATLSEFPERLVSPVVSEIMARLLTLEKELTVLRTRFGENWPAVVQKRTEIELAQQQLGREKSAALTLARDQATLDYQAAEQKRNLFATALEEQKQLVNQQEKATITYDIIRREVETNRKMYEAMLERLQQTSLTAGMEFGGFRIVNPAYPSYRPDSPNVRWNLALAVLLGLALGVCVVLVRDFWSSSISTIDEVEQLTALPVLGTVPYVENLTPPIRLLPRIGTSIVTATRHAMRLLSAGEPQAGATPVPRPAPGGMSSNALAAEAVRSVCASILLSQSEHPPRVLMVTSAAPGEGKTTLATELALALADSHARTLLVECDLRRPVFGATFNIPDAGGLSLYLSGHVGPTPAIHPTANGNLFVVAAGPPVPNPPALLNSARLQAFLSSVTANFDFVILDAPPALAVADARVLAPLTEGVILTVRAGHVSKKMLRRTCALLQHTTLLGVVLNAANAQDVAHPDYSLQATYYRA